MATAAVAPARFPVGNRRILSSWGVGEVYDSRDVSLSVDLEGAMLSDTVFRFLDGSPDSSAVDSSSSSSHVEDGFGVTMGEEEEGGDAKEEDGEGSEDLAARKEAKRVFWEKHHKLLKEALTKTSSTERAIKSATKEAMKEIQASARDGYYNICKCTGSSGGGSCCKDCLMREICRRLRERGYEDCAVWRTNWRSTHDIPSGNHKFILVRTTGAGDEEDRVIIEPRFRAEFEMGIRVASVKAAQGEDCVNSYEILMDRVPAVFVGRPEKMKSVVKILCAAAKRCCKEKKVHLGPWRKHKYMQAKWFSSSCEKLAQRDDDQGVELVVPAVSSSRRSRIHGKASSMLTAAVRQNNSFRPKAVAVI